MFCARPRRAAIVRSSHLHPRRAARPSTCNATLARAERRYPGAGQAFNGAAILEQQNDDALDELAGKVAMLKGVRWSFAAHLSTLPAARASSQASLLRAGTVRDAVAGAPTHRLHTHPPSRVQITTGIHEEVRSQNSFLDSFSAGMENTSGMLTSVTGKIGTMLRSGSNKHMCYLILFAFFIFVLVYLMIRHSLNK